MIPGEDVLVLFEESYQRLVDMWTSEGADLSHSVRSGIVEKYFFKFFNRLCYCSLFFYVYGL